MDILRWNPQRSFSCDACMKTSISSFYCKNCDFDYCYNCADYPEEAIRLNIIRFDEYGHQLKRAFITSSKSINSEKKCKICNMRMNEITLKFCCETCNIFCASIALRIIG